MPKVMANFGKSTGQTDPFLHFYETFLGAYNPEKKKARGVWYTPEPVVNFIVRAVDEVLQTDFGLPLGLADTSKITMDWETGQFIKGKRETIRKDLHKVQILDPATGTGTFLAETIKHIAPKVKGVAEGAWSGYVERDLIPRIHGFELLMASYAMCHTKLGMVLSDMGYEPLGTPPRLRVFLTNALEEGAACNQTLPFAQWLSNEAKGANEIKRDMPIMCIMGNPPYAVSSMNKSAWIEGLMDEYKRDLEERNIQPLSDDYIKFIRLAQHYITKNGEGVLGFITNNSYLDGLIHRQMRKSLMENFDKIYVVDLHGNAKKKEVAPGGGRDVNVFDIQQGVGLIIAVKTGKKDKDTLGQVYHQEFWGTRQAKFDALHKGRLTKGFKKVKAPAPHYFFVPKAFEAQRKYELGFKLDGLFSVSSSGIKTHRDPFAIAFDRNEIVERFDALRSQRHHDKDLRNFYNLRDSHAWSLETARQRARNADVNDVIQTCTYRPFDSRWCIFGDIVMNRPRKEVMKHIANKNNISMSLPKFATEGGGALVSTKLTGHKCFAAYEINYSFPLYLYPNGNDFVANGKRKPNLDPALVARFAKATGLTFIPDHKADGAGAGGTFHPLDLFDYIYAVLHSPGYRDTYQEFLKIDFPRVPYPQTADDFWRLTRLGGALRKLHLMDPATIGKTPYPFEGKGDSIVEKPVFQDGRVFINDTQSFANVPALAWDFYIGGYQPAQKWLKDRKGRALGFDDVLHYQRIVKILCETDRIMQDIG